MRWTAILGLAFLLPMLTACSPTLRRPQLVGPGPAPLQRYNATQFDPYPPNDVAPPIVGGRPIDFMMPPNEVERGRQYLNQQPWRFGPLY